MKKLKIIFGLLAFCLVASTGWCAALVQYVDTDVVGGTGDGSSWANAYSSLSAWEAQNLNLTDNGGDTLTVYCRGTTADTALVRIDGWTTSSTCYIEIIGDNTTGKWNTSAYRSEVTGSDVANITCVVNYVRLYNYQGRITSTYDGIGLEFWAVTGCVIDRCIIKGGASDRNQTGITLRGSNTRITNCIVYDIPFTWSIGIKTNGADGTCLIANNTVINTRYGFYNQNEACNYTNNIAQDCGAAGYDITSNAIATASTNNLSDDATTPEYNTYYDNKDITFLDKVNKDFHLNSTDSNAIDLGYDLSATFTSDIDGQTRTSPWDIGADDTASSSTITPTGKIFVLGGVKFQ